ncbi:hypothetical protein NUU61_000652 [Penicillium alfredii]|uniref:Uncharacterized protein n=1 Tax=Penicillium alfredii TaxID=1506179 RepID=A0A9W9GA32_9EURO|nr:uncharacterized protein NUU61_000652 [Penicillium alfredii]KAJ5114893.1 hypothetical protein NUU61_000652 [Penicillium alfredii]
MLSPSKKAPLTPRTAAPLRGLFKDGEWCCNCPERPIAAKYQTKKEGMNHGRWSTELGRSLHLQTAPSPSLRFLPLGKRRRTALSRGIALKLPIRRRPIDSDPLQDPQRAGNGLLTPQTERQVFDVPPRRTISPPKSAKARMMAEDDYGWNDDSDDNEDLAEALASSQKTEPMISQPNFHPETPSKAARTTANTSPSNRKLSEFAYDYSSPAPAQMASPVSAHTSFTDRFPPSSAEVCMTPTPTKYRDVLHSNSCSDTSSLAQSTLAVLDKHGVVLPNRARDELVAMLNSQHNKLTGINRGRTVLRNVVKSKDEELAKLKERVAHLEAQHELDRTLIDGMKPSSGSSVGGRP